MMLPPPAADHRGQDRAAHQERAADIAPQIPRFQSDKRQIEHGAVRIVTGRAVDQNVDGRKFADDRFSRASDLRLAGPRRNATGEIASACPPIAAAVASAAALHRDRRRRHLPPASAKASADRASDTVAGAGDDRRFSCQRTIIGDRHCQSYAAAAAIRPR